ncbi:UvrD-helicase domain-containing protein [Photobacterium sanguinicancri]|uniref:UvrD-helicase domain-containing protein n=1 Tax=Photobacterium sanguinicancri TaxID=875932 RepID=UPI0026E21EFE|nr:UvrD-helicase domain-containing protein [Photobacterium sanguinicancri]MDO6499595.1 UvrD-helicase domain-containing protein [Photobacterium sanguinicancri]
MSRRPPILFDGKILSDEQCEILEYAAASKNLIINAFAGTGKTFTLRALASKPLAEKRGLYLALNRKIVDDATTAFPESVECRTIHSLAYRGIGVQYARAGRMKQFLNASILCEKVLKDSPPLCGIPPIRVCSMILSGIEAYCHSADTEISREHLAGINLSRVDTGRQNEFRETLFFFVESVWKLLNSPASDIPITPSVYLKIWALKKPKLKFDYILIDEAQDQNPVVIDLLSRQAHLQQIWVGDRYQQIYGFRGAVNALDTIDIETQCILTQSYRYGEEIAQYCNKLLHNLFNDNTDIKGFPDTRSALSSEYEPDVVICRTNFAVIAEVAYQTYIEKKKVSVNADVRALSCDLKEAQKLIDGRRSKHPDFAPFIDWFEVVDFSKTDEGIHLRTMVNLVEQYSVPLLLDLMFRVQSMSESNADIVVSTAHQAKGREWDIVKLADDFRGQGHSKYSEEEGRLLYVAATRAKNILDISDCLAAALPASGEGKAKIGISDCPS